MQLSISKNYGDTNFITGLRAFAAFAVVMIHSGGAGLRDFGLIGNHIADLGRAGVYVFFVISGYSVSASFETSHGYFDYLRKRVFRIAPLYYFWLIFAIIFSVTAKYWQDNFSVQIDTYNVLMHFTFLSFLDYKITNSILGVEWSISIEVFWYLFIPALVSRSKNLMVSTLWVVGTYCAYKFAVSSASLLPLPEQESALAFHWSPIPYMLAYVLGVFAYRLRPYAVGLKRTSDIVLLFAFLLVVIYVIRPVFFDKLFIDELTLVSLATCAFISLGSEGNKFIRCIFSNKLVLFLGEISYGVYLSHMPILNLLNNANLSFMDNATLRFFTLCITSTAASAITFYLIETPGSSLGKYFGRRFESSRKAASS